MIVTLLGTGTSQGVPMIACSCAVCQSNDARDKRLRSSLLIEDRGVKIVIDTGPDFRTQMLRERLQRLDAVLFTHNHKDHTAGLDDVRAFNYFQKKEMNLYADALVEDTIKREFAYAFSGIQYPGIPQLNIQSIGLESFTIKHLTITPIECLHYKLPVKGFRINNFTYITDANYISERELEKIKGTEILILNALRHEEHISHFNLKQAIALSDSLAVPQTYFTHISHQMGLYAEVQPTMPAGKYLAYDGLQLVC